MLAFAYETPLHLHQVLNELELPHVYHSVARNSPKRVEMRQKWDTFQVRSLCRQLLL